MTNTYKTIEEATAAAQRRIAERGHPQGERVCVGEALDGGYEVTSWPTARWNEMPESIWAVKAE